MTQKFNYMLRKTLIPWRLQETVDEVFDYCVANFVGEIIWKIDVLEFCGGFTSLDKIKQYLPTLKKAKARFAEANIITSINPWMTINHADYGRDSREAFPNMRWIVDYSGVQSKACACPLCHTWQDHIVAAYSLYAKVHPNILWVEDDFRHFNHHPVDWGCFCPIHIEKFSKLVGEPLTREELVECILKPGQPHPYRSQWMDFLGNNMVCVAEKITKAVHAISPETKVGLMTSSPDDHSIEGRKWDSLIKAFSGHHSPVVRPHYPPYRHTNMLDGYIGINTIHQTLHCLPDNTQVCPELENAPFTEFNKSIRMTRLQILQAAAMGFTDITMNLYDHLGTPLCKDDRMGTMLRETKTIVDGLLSYCQPNKNKTGVQILFPAEMAAKCSHTKYGSGFSELYSHGDGWSMPLQAMGFPTTYKDSPLVAITGQVTRGLSKEKTLALLSHGVLLDASGAQTLVEDGYGSYIGVDVVSTNKIKQIPISGEEIENNIFISPRQATAQGNVYRFHLHKGAYAASNFVDYHREVYMPGMVYFENALGGRIATHAFDLKDGIQCCYLNWFRMKQIGDALKWLAKNQCVTHISGGAYALPICLEYDTHAVMVIVNHSPDTWPHISIEYDTAGRMVKDILINDASGQWIKADCQKNKGSLHLKINKTLEYLELAAICLQF